MSDVTAAAVAAIADLADALTGIRVLFEQESERYAAERADDAEEKARKDPIRRAAALRELRDTMRGAVHEALPDGTVADEHTLADQLIAVLDTRLRSSYGLRDAFRTLGISDPSENLTDVARRKAVAQLGTSASDIDVERWMNTWLAGALYHERG